MSSLRHLSIALLYCSAAVGFPLATLAQTVTPQGGETPILEANALRGDQILPHASVTGSGGYVVWQDNAIDGDGFGIGARWVDSTLSPGAFGSFRVNNLQLGDQQRPQVATFSSGAAAIVWQGGSAGAQNIFIRFLAPNRVFMTASELRVNVYTSGPQSTPAIGVLSDNKVVVTWASSHQDGSMKGVFARLVSTNGQFSTAPFQVNQYTNYNQRNPAVAVLTNGNFVVLWLSEEQRISGTVDVMGRIYTGAGTAVTPEFRINTADAICANAAVAALASGGFTAVWSQKSTSTTESWDIYARKFDALGAAADVAFRVNENTYGDQFAPSISSLGDNQLVLWTSLGEDGSMEGVFGRLVFAGTPSGSQFLVNTTVNNKQMYPVSISDGGSRFVACWAGFTGVANGFDLFCQRYAAGQPLPIPPAPFVSALRSSQLSVTWPVLTGYPLSYYEIYMDGAAPPNPTARVTNTTVFVQSGLTASTTHTFRLAYVFSGEVRSQLSSAVSGTTWGEDLTGQDGIPDGLPDDWQRLYFGVKAAYWPGPNADSDGDGVSNYREFLAGTNPTDPNSVLKMWFTWNRFGRHLNWNTQPGFVYQVEVSTDLSSWSSFGAPRFAAGATDSSPVGGTGSAEYYRVLRVR